MNELVFYLHNGRTEAWVDRHCEKSRSPRLGKELLRLALSDSEASMPVDDLARRFVTRLSGKVA